MARHWQCDKSSMLVIRNAQMAVLATEAAKSFQYRLETRIQELAKQHGAELDPEALHLQAERGLAAAREFHLRRECDVAALVEIAWHHFDGLPFPSMPKPVLNELWA